MSDARFFRPAFDLLVEYARYHRDRRNIATHLVGVPMIVFSAGVLLSRPTLHLGGLKTSLAWVLFAALSLWTLTRGQWMLGLATTLAMGALVWAAHGVVGWAAAPWVALGVGLFVLGWVIQFVGHYYEGRRPAFTHDVVGLLVGPMFVVLELLAAAGLCRELMGRIEHAAGPTMLRDLAAPLPR